MAFKQMQEPQVPCEWRLCVQTEGWAISLVVPCFEDAAGEVSSVLCVAWWSRSVLNMRRPPEKSHTSCVNSLTYVRVANKTKCIASLFILLHSRGWCRSHSSCQGHTLPIWMPGRCACFGCTNACPPLCLQQSQQHNPTISLKHWLAAKQ